MTTRDRPQPFVSPAPSSGLEKRSEILQRPIYPFWLTGIKKFLSRIFGRWSFIFIGLSGVLILRVADGAEAAWEALEPQPWTSSFEQERYTSLKKVPFRNVGVIVCSPRYGLWIDYPDDDRSLLISQDRVRFFKGDQEQTGGWNEESGQALKAVFALMNFDFEILEEDFETEISGDPAGDWTIRLIPREDEFDFDSLTVQGAEDLPRTILVDRGFRRKVEITIRPPKVLEPMDPQGWEEKTLATIQEDP